MRLLKSSLFLTFAFLFFGATPIFAQTVRKVSGQVTDTAGNAITEANILLVTAADTLKTVSNDKGKFDFKGIKADEVTISITMMGYRSYFAKVKLSDKSTTLSTIILQISGTDLKEVVIKAKPKPIRVLKDTIEFDAAAYNLMEDDRVSDLLKQLPGVEVDDDDNVKTMGKEMVKLRVNGKDFFTNNVQEFIGKLPANIVSKIQIIDNYGDQANFTGDRTGSAEKMLNIVTKPGMNKGIFGNLGFNGGTNDQLGLIVSANVWNDSQQAGITGNAAQADNGAGQSKSQSASVNYRDTFKNNVNSGFNYQISNNNNDNRNISFIETVNALGTIYNDTESIGNSKSLMNNLNWDLQKTGDKHFLNIGIGATFQRSENINTNRSNQRGIIRQDLTNDNTSVGKSPNLNISASWSKRFKKKNRSLSANMFLSTASRTADQQIKSTTVYYDAKTLALLKDSLLNRQIEANNRNLATSINVNYNHPLKQPKDSLASRKLGLAYSVSFANSDNTTLTYVNNKNNQFNLVDSLSNLYDSQSISQNANVNYSYNSKKLTYNFGVSVRPTTLIGNYRGIQQRIKNSVVNYAPNFNLSKMISQTKTLSVRYAGNSISPSATQLQPVRNTQNLQNVIIGNPDLKPSFNHSINTSYNYVHLATGRSFQGGISMSTTQNQIVRNVVLIQDTLNSLKQETRFENASGGFDVNGNYNVSLPFSKNKYNVSVNGNFGFNNTISFADNVKYFNKGMLVSQTVSANMTTKKFNANAHASYSFSTNNFTLNSGTNRNIETWNFSVSTRATLFKTYRFGATANKRINTGYAIQNNNPLLIGASFSKIFFKKRSLTFNANAHDLLNQGNNLYRSIVGNSVVDSQSNQITRYFTFGLTYNLQKFGESK